MTKPQLILSFLYAKCMRVVLRPLCLLPVRQNRALFSSFRGKQYSCNPRAVSEALAGEAGGKCEIIWAFHEPERFSFLKERGVKVMRDRGLKFILTALTSRVVCTNTYYKPQLPRRKDQFYLRTWHGGGAYKRVDYPAGLMGKYIRMQQQGADLYLSSSKAFTKLTLRDSFGYDGEVLECGMPRNDALVSGLWRERGEEVRRELGLENKKIALYAPSYRDSGERISAPDAQRLRSALERRFGGSFALLYRGHHVGCDTNFVCDMDVSAYGDMQPLLMAADVLITDFSSSIWDFSLTGKPAFLYCPDLEKIGRGFYSDLRALPFPMAESDAALEKNIISFDEAAYTEKVKEHHETLGSCETGHAAKDAAERILRECAIRI